MRRPYDDPSPDDPWAPRAAAGPPVAWAPPRPGGRSTTLPRVLAAGLLLLGLVGAALGAFGLLTHRHMEAHAIGTPATVTSVDATFDYVAVVFRIDDEPVAAEVSWYGPHPRPGEVVDVDYDPDDPTYARMPGGREDLWLGVAFLGAGALSLAGGAVCCSWAVRRSRRNQSPDGAAAP